MTQHGNGRPKVVIVGAGFAGINAAKGLKKADVDITIIDRNNFHTFQPLLYQVSTAYLAPEEVSETVRSIFRKQKNVHFKVGNVVGADFDGKTVQLETGESLPYDYLLLGVGSTANFFGIQGMEENSWPLYTLADAVRLRTHLLTELERAAAEPGAHPERSTVVVVGAGPTGVEMAGTLANMGQEFIGEGVQLKVYLVEALPRVLINFSEVSSARAQKALEKKGVEVLLDTKVASADENGVVFADGNRIDSATLIWGAGVRSSGLGADLGLELGRGGSIVVGPDLQVEAHPGVFAAGDTAANISDGKPVPPLAQTAIQGGKLFAKNVQHLINGESTEPFKYWDKGIMAVIGKGAAVAELPKPKVKLGGPIAWLAWLGVHLMYLAGYRNRLRVLVDWGFAYLTNKGSGAVLVRGAEARGETATEPSPKPANN